MVPVTTMRYGLVLSILFDGDYCCDDGKDIKDQKIGSGFGGCEYEWLCQKDLKET